MTEEVVDLPREPPAEETELPGMEYKGAYAGLRGAMVALTIRAGMFMQTVQEVLHEESDLPEMQAEWVKNVLFHRHSMKQAVDSVQATMELVKRSLDKLAAEYE